MMGGSEMSIGTKSVVAEQSSAMKKVTVGGIVVLVLAIGLSIAAAKGVFSSSATNAAANSASADKSVVTPASVPLIVEEQGAGMKAIQQAAADKKYLFAFFWNNDNEQTAAMRGVFDQAIAKVTDRAQAVAVKVSDPAERGIVKKFEVDRAPMPLVLAIAPNGAVMGGFPTKFEENDLLAAFSSPCAEQCIKSLQDGKLVLVCVQNGSTKFNEEALRGVNEFKADEKFGSATEVVMLDPADSAETSFLGDLKIEAKTTVAKTAFIAPSGALIAEYEGATTKDELMAALQKANSSCGPGGCGPGGCGPGGCAPQ